MYTLPRLQKGASGLGTFFWKSYAPFFVCFPFFLTEDCPFPCYAIGHLLSYKSEVRSALAGWTTSALADRNSQASPPTIGAR